MTRGRIHVGNSIHLEINSIEFMDFARSPWSLMYLRRECSPAAAALGALFVASPHCPWHLHSSCTTKVFLVTPGQPMEMLVPASTMTSSTNSEEMATTSDCWGAAEMMEVNKTLHKSETGLFRSVFYMIDRFAFFHSYSARSTSISRART